MSARGRHPSNIGEDETIGFVVRCGRTHLLCMPKWNWILDGRKWNAAWERRGMSGNDFADRGGIIVLDGSSVDAFLSLCGPYRVDPADLTSEILRHAERSSSWWDAEPCFPKLMADFDREALTISFQPERDPSWDFYVPSKWSTVGDDFVTRPETSAVDPAFRYWTVGEENLLHRFLS